MQYTVWSWSEGDDKADTVSIIMAVPLDAVSCVERLSGMLLLFMYQATRHV